MNVSKWRSTQVEGRDGGIKPRQAKPAIVRGAYGGADRDRIGIERSLARRRHRGGGEPACGAGDDAMVEEQEGVEIKEDQVRK